jgi:hypothetical protein
MSRVLQSLSEPRNIYFLAARRLWNEIIKFEIILIKACNSFAGYVKVFLIFFSFLYTRMDFMQLK